MKTQITVADLDQLGVSAQAIGQVQGLPFKVSYWAARLSEKLKTELAVLGETRQQIFKEHGTINGEGTSFNFEPEKIGVVNALLADLAKTQLEVELPQIRLADLSQAQGLTGVMLAPVLFLINEQEGA